MARLIAAESALRNFIQLKDGAVLTSIKAQLDPNIVDFTSDVELSENGVVGGGGNAANGNEQNLTFLSLYRSILYPHIYIFIVITKVLCPQRATPPYIVGGWVG